jgi:hypothetical protein
LQKRFHEHDDKGLVENFFLMKNSCSFVGNNMEAHVHISIRKSSLVALENQFLDADVHLVDSIETRLNETHIQRNEENFFRRCCRSCFGKSSLVECIASVAMAALGGSLTFMYSDVPFLLGTGITLMAAGVCSTVHRIWAIVKTGGTQDLLETENHDLIRAFRAQRRMNVSLLEKQYQNTSALQPREPVVLPTLNVPEQERSPHEPIPSYLLLPPTPVSHALNAGTMDFFLRKNFLSGDPNASRRAFSEGEL